MTIAAVVSAARSMFASDERKPSTLHSGIRTQLQSARVRYHQEIAAIVRDAASTKRPSTGESWGDLAEIGADDPEALAEFLASPVIAQHQTRFSGEPEYREEWQGGPTEDGSRTEYRKVRVLAR